MRNTAQSSCWKNPPPSSVQPQSRPPWRPRRGRGSSIRSASRSSWGSTSARSLARAHCRPFSRCARKGSLRDCIFSSGVSTGTELWNGQFWLNARVSGRDFRYCRQGLFLYRRNWLTKVADFIRWRSTATAVLFNNWKLFWSSYLLKKIRIWIDSIKGKHLTKARIFKANTKNPSPTWAEEKR